MIFLERTICPIGPRSFTFPASVMQPFKAQLDGQPSTSSKYFFIVHIDRFHSMIFFILGISTTDQRFVFSSLHLFYLTTILPTSSLVPHIILLLLLILIKPYFSPTESLLSIIILLHTFKRNMYPMVILMNVELIPMLVSCR